MSLKLYGEIERKAAKLYTDTNLPIGVIAIRFGVAKSAIHHMANRLNLPKRGGGQGVRRFIYDDLGLPIYRLAATSRQRNTIANNYQGAW